MESYLITKIHNLFVKEGNPSNQKGLEKETKNICYEFLTKQKLFLCFQFLKTFNGMIFYCVKYIQK